MSRNIWILLAIVLIVVIIYFVNKKNKSTEIPNAVQNLVQNSGLGNVISSGSGSGSVNVTTPPPIKTSGYSFGDKLYAKENAVNTYKTASATSGNLASYKGYEKDQLIGTYLSKESGFVKILIASPASSVFVLSTQVYSK